ncbi:MAG: Gfo/Idh/MocA family oxidoreductase [Nitrospirae bacterium]|nr:Gfo/Idh/MocA family oxidoreductase [Nitrospirota bacterium]
MARRFGSSVRDVALIGCGQFAYSNIGYALLTKRGLCIKSCYDIDLKAASSLADGLSVMTVAAEVDEIMRDPDVKVVYVASNHASHSDYAIRAITANKAVYIEKPISVTFEQLKRLAQARRNASSKVYAGYNRPFAPAIKELKRTCDDFGQPLTLSCFILAHQLAPDHWYRDEGEGSRICGNAGHWIDLAIHMLSWGNLPDKWVIDLTWADDHQRDENLVINLTSERHDLINIVFSARTEPFEGVSERINFQLGSTIARIDDFRSMTLWKGESLRRFKFTPKDAGHTTAILQPFHELRRNFDEVEMSTALMLKIADMIAKKERSARFMFSTLWRELRVDPVHKGSKTFVTTQECQGGKSISGKYG